MSVRLTCAVLEQSSVPLGASSIWVETRTWSPARSRVPVTTTSTPASAAMAFRSGASAANRWPAAVERTTSASSPDSEPVIASGTLKARKSISGSGRSTRNGSTISRVIARACGLEPVSISAQRGADLASHRRGVGIAVRRPLGEGDAG